MKITLIATCTLVLAAVAVAGPPATFTKKPTAVRDGDRVRVDFAASCETDVTVWVEDGAGKVVRHIGAARLGAKKVPEPFQPDKLEQSILWDGKDDSGATVPKGCRVTAALGLSPAFEDILGQDDQNLPPVVGLGTGPDGRLYVLAEGVGDGSHGVHMLVLDRSGKYERTVLPTPPSLAWDRVEGLGPIKVADGGWLPRLFCPTGRSFFPLTGRPTKGNSADAHTVQTMAVSSRGVIYRVNRVYDQHHLSMMSGDGGVPGKTTIGPFFSKVGAAPPMALALSPDDKWLYAGGVASPGETNAYKSKSSHVIWRLSLEPMGKPEPFLGELDKPGNDDRHLNTPKGVACDAKGLVYVADSGNNRVTVFDPAGKKAGQVDVESPQLVAVNSKTGGIYILSYLPKGRARLTRFDGPAATQPSAETDIRHGPRLPMMAADFAGERPVLWFGSDGDYGAPILLRVEDQGGKFGDAVEVGKGGGVRNFHSLGLDPASDDLFVRLGWYEWVVFKGGSGRGEKLVTGDEKGATMDVGPDGSRWWLGRTLTGVKQDGIRLVRTRSDNKTHLPLPGGKLGLPLDCDNLNSRGFCVGPDGSAYAVQYAKENHGPTELRAFNADGSPKKGDGGVLIAGLGADACSPQVDRSGRIYVADSARPPGEVVPARFRDNKLLLSTEGDVHNAGADFYPQSYGAILRFGPRGGSVEKIASADQAGSDPLLVTPAHWNEKPTFDYPGCRMLHVAARGCDLVMPGISPIVAEAGGQRIYCQCQHAEFRLDRFDRIFVPDALGFEVRVHDSEGNLLSRFGGYGNADCKGPKSAKPKPEIPLTWGFSVMVSDRFAYVGDNLNRRVVKVRLNYTEEKSCDLP